MTAILICVFTTTLGVGGAAWLLLFPYGLAPASFSEQAKRGAIDWGLQHADMVKPH